MSFYLGIDVGTSGVRTAVIDPDCDTVASAHVQMPPPDLVDGRPQQAPLIWWRAVDECLRLQREILRSSGFAMSDIEALAVDGTSGTLLLCDSDLTPVTPGLMYNSAGFDAEAAIIDAAAPTESIARGSNSALARLLFLQASDTANAARYALHQADWIAAMLMVRGGLSDENNVLKLGYEIEARRWPEWFDRLGLRLDLLPDVHPAGAQTGEVADAIVSEFGFLPGTRVIAGTTDSNAAFLASGASEIGDGVTSLGTTLAIKLLSDRPVSDPSRGIYSHRIGDMWLSGGASNTGGGVLLAYFDRAALSELDAKLDPQNPTGLDYYPLLRRGERFPVNDPALMPRLEPRPNDDAIFYQGILESIARIEARGYAALRELGAPALSRVFSSGGGARNMAWKTMRENALNVSILSSRSEDAACGAALLARMSLVG